MNGFSADGHASWDLLSAYSDQEVEPTDAAALERHILTCSRCTAELADLEAVRRRLQSLALVAPPRGFTLPEPARAPDPVPLRRERHARLVLWTRAAAALAALFFVLILSLDLLGVGANVGVSSTLGRQQVPSPKVAAPAAAPAPAASSARSEGPAATDKPVESTPASGAPVGSLSTAPPAPVPSSDTPVRYAPLRLVSIGAGLLALVLAVGAVLAGRRAHRPGPPSTL